MKPFNPIRVALISLGLFWIALMWAAPIAAQTEQPRQLVITAVNVTAESDKASGVERKDAAGARPGDVIGYSLAFTNVTRGSVKHVQFVDPLPKGLVYLPGSARADKPVQVDYSIDGGKTYAAQPTITVEKDGRRMEEPASREAYTHIRWTVSGPLGPSAQVTAEFQAEVSKAAIEAK